MYVIYKKTTFTPF